jgi:hypothetical protein
MTRDELAGQDDALARAVLAAAVAAATITMAAAGVALAPSASTGAASGRLPSVRPGLSHPLHPPAGRVSLTAAFCPARFPKICQLVHAEQ